MATSQPTRTKVAEPIPDAKSRRTADPELQLHAQLRRSSHGWWRQKTLSGLPIAQRAYTYVPYREGLLVSTVSVSVGGRCFRELLSYYDQRIYWDLALLQSAVASRGRKKAARRIKTHTPPRIKIRLLMELRTRTTHSKPSTSHNRTANV